MSYTAPSGSVIAYDFTVSPYTAPAGNAIVIDLSPALPAARSESFSITDTVALVSITYSASISESFSLVDSSSQTYTLVYPATLTESYTVTDISSELRTVLAGVAESYSVTVAQSVSADLSKVVIESFHISDVIGIGRDTSAAITESFSVFDAQDFNPFPVNSTGINFDFRINHLGYAAPAGNSIAFNIPQDGQYFYSKDNLIANDPPAQMPNLPGEIVAGGDPYLANVVLNIPFLPVTAPDGFVDTSLSAHTVYSHYVNWSTVHSRFGSGYAVADLAGSIAVTDGYIYVDDSNDWNFGADPFTIDVSVMWYADLWGIQGFITQWGGSSECGWWLGYIYGKLSFHWSKDGFDNYALDFPFTPTLGTWYDVSVDRAADGTIRLYVNESVVATIITHDVFHNSNRPLIIGSDNNNGLYDHVTFRGYVGAARVTGGVARYQGSKPLLVEPYPIVAGTGDSRRVGIQPTISCIPYPFP